MPDSSVHTTQLHRWLERIRSDDRAARDELLRALGARLERLAQKMLHRFADVRRWAETGDLLQNALVRLLRALEQVEPVSMAAFFGLAAEQMRRELLDLARHFYGPQGIGANHATNGSGGPAPPEPQSPADDAQDLERWCAFHEAVAALPAEERAVVDLLFYHGQSQAEAAEELSVTVRTVQRRWPSARLLLHDLLHES
jgi:RNA polymerase sigma-70 factor (ECF subfamily)